MKIQSLLSAVLMLSAASGAYAVNVGDTYTEEAHGIVYTVIDAEAKTVSVAAGSTFAGTVIEIPSTVTVNGEECTVTAVADKAFMSKAGITSVTLPETITSIGTSAFASCSNLSSINLPESVTTWGKQIFQTCKKLPAPIIPKSMTVIPEMMYAYCSFVDIVIPDNIKEIGKQAFYNNTSCKTITLPEGLTTVDYMGLYNCKAVTELYIPETVTTLGYRALGALINLEKVNVPSKLTTVGDQVFYNAKAIKTIYCLGETLPTVPTNFFETATYTTATLLCLPSADESSLQEPWVNYNVIFTDDPTGSNVLMKDDILDEGMFRYTVISPEGLTASVALNPDYTGTVGDVVLPSSVEIKGKTLKVTQVAANGFTGCKTITSVNIPASINTVGYQAFYNCTNLATTNLPTTVTTWGDMVFCSCTAMESVEIPEEMTTIPNQMFMNTSMKNFTIPANITNIGQAAYQNTAITEITIPETVKVLGASAFRQCKQLESVNVADGSSFLQVGAYAFGDNPVLKTVYCSARPVDVVTNMFNNCPALTDVTLAEGLGAVKADAFKGCTSLQSIVLPEGMTEVFEGFYNCTSLTSVTFPSTMASITDAAFRNCGFTTITIPESVTRFGSNAFYGCANLTTVYLPASLTSIGGTNYNFVGCPITDVYTSATTLTYFNANNFDTNVYSTATLHVLPEVINTVKNIGGWQNFAKVVEIKKGELTGIEAVEAEAEAAEYYNLQGVRVAEPAAGRLYIVRRGATVTKELR